MQDSFLENEDNSDQLTQGSQQIAGSSLKMYSIELPFLANFREQLQQIQTGVQEVLVALSNCQEGEKKRLPYNVLRSFEKNVKEIRGLRERVAEDNKVYHHHVANREKEKNGENGLFKQYLKQLGGKRQELKAYINKVETRVRQLEDTGYAQFIQFDVVVPEVNTIRFSYAQKAFLNILATHNGFADKITQQLATRKNLVQKLKHKDGQKLRQSKVPLFYSKDIELLVVLNGYHSYKFYSNECIMALKILKLRRQNSNLREQVEKVKVSLKLNQQLIFKQKLRVGVLNQDPALTKTDHLIYWKHLQKQIKDKVEGRIFLFNWRCKMRRSASAPPASIYFAKE